MIRTQRLILWLLLLQLATTAACLGVARAQSQETVNAVTQQHIGTIDSRITQIEDEVRRNNADARLLVLESDMTEVKWLGRSVAGLVAGQLVVLLFGLRNGKPRHA